MDKLTFTGLRYCNLSEYTRHAGDSLLHRLYHQVFHRSRGVPTH